MAVIFILKNKEVHMAKAKYSKSKSGYFRTKVWDGTYNADGSKHRIDVTSKKSSADLERKVNEIKNRVSQNDFIASSTETVYDYALYWLDTYKSVKSRNTYLSYKRTIEYHLQDFYSLKMQSLTRGHIQQLINSRFDKPRTCKLIALVIKQVVKSAIKDGILAPASYEVICTDISLPKYTAKKKEVIKSEVLDRILDIDFTDREKCFLYIIYGCGLRREEALALTKDDIDFNSSEISVSKALCFDGNNAYIKEPKSQRGYRRVPMPAFLKEFLQAYTQVSGYNLITKKDGNIITESSYMRMWKSIQNKIDNSLGIGTSKGITAHSFRHNYCTRLCYQIPLISTKMIAKLLGDNERMVIDVYSHILEEKEDCQSAIANIFE